MPTPTYDLIEEKVLGSAAASVTFSSIPGTYKDLVLEAQPLKSTTGGGTLRYQVNSDTGSNYSNTTLYQENNTVYSDRASNATFGRIGFWNGTSQGNILIVNFQSYANTNVNKTSITRAGNASAIVGTIVNLWRSTSAITSIYLYNDGGNFDTGSTFRLWGVSG